MVVWAISFSVLLKLQVNCAGDYFLKPEIDGIKSHRRNCDTDQSFICT